LVLMVVIFDRCVCSTFLETIHFSFPFTMLLLNKYDRKRETNKN
jgi:hypothetical protein